MPELPEVETVKETLKTKILGEKIASVSVYYETMIDKLCRSDFSKMLVGETLTDIKRYGKYLFFIFENVSLISHLRMEGKYFIKLKEEPRNIHEHIIFTFESGKTLRYHDTRKFGTMKLVKTTVFSEVMMEPELKKLGKEANDETIDIDNNEWFNTYDISEKSDDKAYFIYANYHINYDKCVANSIIRNYYMFEKLAVSPDNFEDDVVVKFNGDVVNDLNKMIWNDPLNQNVAALEIIVNNKKLSSLETMRKINLKTLCQTKVLAFLHTKKKI